MKAEIKKFTRKGKSTYNVLLMDDDDRILDVPDRLGTVFYVRKNAKAAIPRLLEQMEDFLNPQPEPKTPEEQVQALELENQALKEKNLALKNELLRRAGLPENQPPAKNTFPWALEQVLQGETVRYSDFEREYLMRFDNTGDLVRASLRSGTHWYLISVKKEMIQATDYRLYEAEKGVTP